VLRKHSSQRARGISRRLQTAAALWSVFAQPSVIRAFSFHVVVRNGRTLSLKSRNRRSMDVKSGNRLMSWAHIFRDRLNHRS